MRTSPDTLAPGAIAARAAAAPLPPTRKVDPVPERAPDSSHRREMAVALVLGFSFCAVAVFGILKVSEGKSAAPSATPAVALQVESTPPAPQPTSTPAPPAPQPSHSAAPAPYETPFYRKPRPGAETAPPRLLDRQRRRRGGLVGGEETTQRLADLGGPENPTTVDVIHRQPNGQLLQEYGTGWNSLPNNNHLCRDYVNSNPPMLLRIMHGKPPRARDVVVVWVRFRKMPNETLLREAQQVLESVPPP